MDFLQCLFLCPFLFVVDTVATLEVQVQRVRVAIAAIVGGAQEYKIGNRSLTRANLSTLYARESSLKNAIARRDGDDILYANTGRL